MTGNPDTRRLRSKERGEDTIERLGSAVVQHGPLSDRVYLMKLGDPARAAEAAEKVLELARFKGYGKIFAKVPSEACADFFVRGFREEARVPGMLRGKKDVRFLARYPKPERSAPCDAEAVKSALASALARAGKAKTPRLGVEYELRVLGQESCQEMAALYGQVFASYPFPIHDPRYLAETMRSHVRYVGAFRDGRLAALASAEVDMTGRNAEMTDFATLPEHRGEGLASLLLVNLEAEASRLGVLTAYTIARAVSPGMNIVFSRAGYAFAGTLTRNTNIAGRIECMNVWHKALGKRRARLDGRKTAA